MHVNQIQTNAGKRRHDDGINNESWKLLQPKKSMQISAGSSNDTGAKTVIEKHFSFYIEPIKCSNNLLSTL